MFRACDIPEERSQIYATLFSNEHIRSYQLAEFSRDDLKELGVGSFGDRVSVLSKRPEVN